MSAPSPLEEMLAQIAGIQALSNATSSGISVTARFARLLENLRLTQDQREDGITKHSGVRSCLNSHYYGTSSGSANSMLVGSWGKSTEIRPPRDIDVMFVLPYEVYQRFESRPGNKQSQLLQEVKSVLARTYQSTDMSGDGQVIVVRFISYGVEVVPAFKLTSGQYWICDTNNGGRYKRTDPIAEIDGVKQSNDQTIGNTRDLIRMVKRWQEHCSVPLKSFVIELLAIDFLRIWEYRGKGSTYYDWMTRDFFRWLKQKSAYNYVTVPGTSETIYLGDDWKSKAESACGRAEKACDHEAGNRPYSAGEEWQKIFGTFIPIS